MEQDRNGIETFGANLGRFGVWARGQSTPLLVLIAMFLGLALYVIRSEVAGARLEHTHLDRSLKALVCIHLVPETAKPDINRKDLSSPDLGRVQAYVRECINAME